MVLGLNLASLYHLKLGGWGRTGKGAQGLVASKVRRSQETEVVETNSKCFRKRKHAYVAKATDSPIKVRDRIDLWGSFFFFFVLLPFLGLLPRHMEVPRPGVGLELQLSTCATATPDPSRIHDLHCTCGNTRSFDLLSEAGDWPHILMGTSWALTSIRITILIISF